MSVPGFEVRDVHPTHYGPHHPDRGRLKAEHRPQSARSRPYARVNEYGFIESPPQRSWTARSPSEIVYLSAMEGTVTSSPRPTPRSTPRQVRVRNWCSAAGGSTFSGPSRLGRYRRRRRHQSSRSPRRWSRFWKHDDANRALNGHNVAPGGPGPSPRSPLVGTGMEEIVGARLRRKWRD